MGLKLCYFLLALVMVGGIGCFFQISLYLRKVLCRSVLDIKCQYTLKIIFVKLLIIVVVGR